MIKNKIQNYNAQEKEIFDKCAEVLLSQIEEGIDAIYNSGEWSRMIGVTELGVTLKSINRNFKEFKFEILTGYLMREGKTVVQEFKLKTFAEFLKGNYLEEICGFCGEEIILLKPLYEAIKRKGYEVLVDEEDHQLVLIISIH